MEITVTKNTQSSRYEGVLGDGTIAGFAVYREQGDRVVFPHTFTEPKHRGHDVAATVVKAALDDVRASGKMAVPVCWYVAEYIENHPEYADLLDTRR